MPRVLIVDDDPDIRNLVSLKLTTSGYDVDEAADGEAGLAQALQPGVDLVVLDITMPRLDGIEVCKRIRSSDRSDLPVILLTAKARDEDVAVGTEAKADEYIIKPFSPKELLECVTKLLPL